MGVYIKDMDMPSSCAKCEFASFQIVCIHCMVFPVKVSLVTAFTGRSEYCPLVEVKTPHGELKDTDAILKGKEDIDIKEIMRAETIIKAEK